MKSNELRIGNWVVEYDGSQTKMAADMFVEPFISRLKPIPLNPEIMKQFGFDTDGDGVYVKSKCLYWLAPSTIQIAMGYTPVMNVRCEYVHQLQNLIFALTGNELIYTP